MLKYLQQIEDATGTNAKRDILERMIEDNTNECMFMFSMIYGDTNFNVSSRSFEKILGFENNEELSKYEDAGEMMKVNTFGALEKDFYDFEEFMKEMITKTGNEQLDFIRNYFEDLHPENSKWYSRIIVKNLRIGVTLTTINKVLRSLGLKTIDKFEVQLCGKYNDIEEYDGDFPCIASIKYDGFRCIAEKSGNMLKLTSRQGKDVDFVPEIEKDLLKYDFDFTIDGEIMAKDFNAIQKRIGRKIDNIEPVDGLHFRVFDILSLNGESLINRKQGNRQGIIVETFEQTDLLKFEEFIYAKTIDELIKYYKMACDRGEEGIIVKNIDAPYEYGGRSNWFKIKPVFENSFRVVGFNMGRGKHKDYVGSLDVEDGNKRVCSNVGSGINDDMRILLTSMMKEEKLLGIIVEVKYNEITSKADGTSSLRFPRFLKIRSDLVEADKL